jgi:hypothetical protein
MFTDLSFIKDLNLLTKAAKEMSEELTTVIHYVEICRQDNSTICVIVPQLAVSKASLPDVTFKNQVINDVVDENERPAPRQMVASDKLFRGYTTQQGAHYNESEITDLTPHNEEEHHSDITGMRRIVHTRVVPDLSTE